MTIRPILLTANFSLDELIYSKTAEIKGISNTPPQLYLDNLIDLCEHVLQPLRDGLGVPITVTSGYRSKSLNKAIGGSLTSQHSYGQAADIESPYVSNRTIADYIRKHLPFDQLIEEYPDENDEPAWIHVSFNKYNNRTQHLIAYKDENNYTRYRYA